MSLMRRVLLFLVAANILLLLWGLVRPAGVGPGSAVENNSPQTLALLSEHTGDLLARAAERDSMEGEGQCLMWGPFESADGAGVAMLGADFEFRIEELSLPSANSPRYRAMIAPSPTLTEAREKLAEVSAAIERLGGGIDTYLVTSGALANSVSLGLFNERANAISVQRSLAGEDIDVVVETELRLETHYWVLADDAKAIDFIDETSGVDGFVSVPAELSENLCEMIAQAQ